MQVLFLEDSLSMDYFKWIPLAGILLRGFPIVGTISRGFPYAGTISRGFP